MVLSRWWRKRIPRYRLVGAKCLDCGRVHYPPRASCPYCGSRRLEEVRLPRTGVLESVSVVYSVPGDSRFNAPILVGLVRLDNGVRVVAELTDAGPGEVSPGDRVEAVLRRVAEDGETGVIAYAVKFRPLLRGANGGGAGEDTGEA